MSVGYMVPRFIYLGVAEAVVGAEIDDFNRCFRKGFADGHGVSVRQCNENKIAVFSNGFQIIHTFQSQIGNASHMRIYIGQGLAGMTFRSNMG